VAAQRANSAELSELPGAVPTERRFDERPRREQRRLGTIVAPRRTFGERACDGLVAGRGE
jgi:hypothetical protein